MGVSQLPRNKDVMSGQKFEMGEGPQLLERGEGVKLLALYLQACARNKVGGGRRCGSHLTNCLAGTVRCASSNRDSKRKHLFYPGPLVVTGWGCCCVDSQIVDADWSQGPECF